MEDFDFLHRLYGSIQWEDQELSVLLDLEEEGILSHFCALSGIQDGFSLRALRRARRVANSLFDEQGDISQATVDRLIALFQNQGYLFYPDGSGDYKITEHIHSVLLQLADVKDLNQRLRKFRLPLPSLWAEELIMQTLGMQMPLTTVAVRRAVITTCLFPLRQSVGSCFATAPAILIQAEQPHALIEDLYQLLFLGKLKKTFDGVEYAVPLSVSTGVSTLYQPVDQTKRVGLSPGLILGFERAGFFPAGLSWERRAEEAENIVLPYLHRTKTLSLERLIHQVVLGHFQVGEEDVNMALQWERSQAKRLQYQRPSQQIQKAMAACRAEKQIQDTFKSLFDNALLKAWEFTIASFSEIKMEFSSWNFYTSLGLDRQEVDGIGELIYQFLDEKVQRMNEKIQEAQQVYTQAVDALRATERLLSQAGGEGDVRRLRAELQARSYHMRACLDMHDLYYSQGSECAALFPLLMKQYTLFFSIYFQEVYDPQMSHISQDPYEDSPAGFRLVYKHGRSDPSQWTLIDQSDDYISALCDFFSLTEPQIAALCAWKGGEEIVLEITSAIISHVSSTRFLEGALRRMRKVHREAGEKTPWAYTSGGTMTTLLKTYFCRSLELTQESRWVESESELLIFLLDTLKNLPYHSADRYVQRPNQRMLISSPSHAFILQPGWKAFMEGWQDRGFTYTFVRDQVIVPNQVFYAQMRLTQEEQLFLVHELLEGWLPAFKRHIEPMACCLKTACSVVDFRNQVLQEIPVPTAQMPLLADAVDGFLYQVLPVVSGTESVMLMQQLLVDVMDEKLDNVLNTLVIGEYVTGKSVKNLVKGCYLKAYAKRALVFDLHAYVEERARLVGLNPPCLILFADTNWVNQSFGFVVNPGTSRLELWRLQGRGESGAPMRSWQPWLNGSNKSPWVIYTHPDEYG